MKVKPGADESGENSAGNKTEGTAAWRRRLLKVLLLLVALAVSALVAETVLRLFFRARLQGVQDERNLLYRYDPMLGWFPNPNSSNHFRASRDISVVHNSEGFRDSEYSLSNKPRIIFLGDSFVWGYDVEAPERFTDKLRARHPEWSIYNFGVSGYGTDQEYILLQKRYDFYKPRVVFLMFCTETDEIDNSHNSLWGYYKPYCTVEGTRLELHGTPVPRSARVFFAEHDLLSHCYVARLLVLAYYRLAAPPRIQVEPNPTGAIIRDLQKYVQTKGGLLVVGVTQHNPPLEEFLRFFKIPFVDLSNPMRYVNFGQHWTPEGHTFVAQKVEEFLVKGKFLEENPTAAQP